jgi:hypothetical protein
MWIKMRALPWAIALRRVAAEVIATILPSDGQSPSASQQKGIQKFQFFESALAKN